MELSEFYTRVGGDYAEVKSRLMTDDRIRKYLKKFPNTGDYENLQKALSDEAWTDAFRFSHNLKGMCLNLGLMNLFTPSSELCENLRPGYPEKDCTPMMADVTKAFEDTVAVIIEAFGE